MPPSSLLLQIAGPTEHDEIWSLDSCVDGWLAFERALVLAQSDLELLPAVDAARVVQAADLDAIDREQLWASARNVGYPVLGLVRQIAGALPPASAHWVHRGATTQDVMDTATALQMQRSIAALDRGLVELGSAMARLVAEHRRTVIAARTHAQQAVPTTYGATLATTLDQLGRHRDRLREADPRISVVSLYGAGGTSAAYGGEAAGLRQRVGARLGLGVRNVPWHVDRDALAEFGWLCATITATCARLARNVVDLSRTEVAEVSERRSPHRGASSTMPQKANAISSEIILGAAAAAGALTSALPRIQEAGHERSAGEWQAEWQVLPQLAVLAGRALAEAADLIGGLEVDAARMRENLALDGGLVMSESVMMQLADRLGQAGAHDLVTAAAARVRAEGVTLVDAVRQSLEQSGAAAPELDDDADRYLGEAEQICEAALDQWSSRSAVLSAPRPLDLLARS